MDVRLDDVRYFVFDIESVADGELVSRLRYPGQSLTGEEAIACYRQELLEKYESDFIPYTYQVPVSVVVGKVDRQFRLQELVALDEPQFRSHEICELFWRGWKAYRQPTLVSFNGRSFDLPLLELAAFRYGISVPEWFRRNGPSYELPRHRYNTDAQLDLQDLLTNFGASRFTGGLNLAANLLGKPGKMDVQGDMVQDMFNAGRLDEINDYCRCDVLDTYFVFLRSRVLVGELQLDQEQEMISQTKQWLESQASQVRAFELYLDRWGDWPDPWHAAVGSAGE